MIRGAGRMGPGATVGVLLLLPVLGGGFDPLRVRNAAVERGNAALAAGRAKDALAAYDQALAEQPDAQGIHFNRGVALHRLGQHEAARQALLRATQGADRALRAKSFYNLGDIDFEQKRFGEAATAFQQALRFDPAHRAAKWNLELALRRREQEQKKKEQQQKENQQQKGNQQQKENRQQEEQQQNQQQNQQQRQDQQQKPTSQGDQGARPDRQQPPREPAPTPPPTPRETPREAAARAAKAAAAQQGERERQQVLEALDRNDKNVQREQARRLQGLYRPPAKDW